MTLQIASNKFLKCHIQAVGDQGARLDMEVPVGTGVRPSIMPSIGVCVGVALEALTEASVGSPEGAERCQMSMLLQSLEWLANAEGHGLELKTPGQWWRCWRCSSVDRAYD